MPPRTAIPLSLAVLLVVGPLGTAVGPALPAAPAASASGDGCGAPEDGYEDHAPIRIHGNDDFAHPTEVSGVRCGSGTAEDPYVISGWELRPLNAYAALEVDALAPDVEVRHSGPGCQATAPAAVSAGAFPVGIAGYAGVRRHGVEIVNTDAHVVIRDNYIHPRPDEEPVDSDRLVGVYVENAANVRIENNRIGNTSEPRLYHGVCMKEAQDVVVGNNTIRHTVRDPLHVHEGADIVLRGNTLDVPASETPYGLRVDETSGVVIADNVIRGHKGPAIKTIDAPQPVIRGNTLAASGKGLLLENGDGARIERNVVRDHVRHGIDIGLSRNVEVHDNNIHDNGGYGLQNLDRPQVDAEMNYWGCPDGPDDADCDDVAGTVDYDPWRSEPVADAGAG